MDVAEAVARMGGVARTRELRAASCTPESIAWAVHRGRVIRMRIGWFGLPTLPDEVVRAHRVGGVPACATVAQLHKLWMLGEQPLHIEVAHNDSRFRSQTDAARAIQIRKRDDVRVHWTRGGVQSPRTGQGLAPALRKMATCVGELEAICAIDSALNRGLVSLEELGTHAGPATLRVLARCAAEAESGVESVFRLRATNAGFSFRTQVELPGSRVDFLFGDRLVVEVDGAEHHAGLEAFVADRERDAWHAALGYRVIRLTYAQVVHRWYEVESLLRLLHSHGEHLSPLRIRR